MEEEFQQQLYELGIHPSDDILRSGTPSTMGLYQDANVANATASVRFTTAQLTTCFIQGVGDGICILTCEGNAYQIVRTLRKCIYGKVKHAVRLQSIRAGVYARSTDQVAIKIMNKGIIQEGLLQENPMIELAAQQYLGNPGHINVLTLLECLEDAENIYAITPYCNGGELFSVVEAGGAFSEQQARFWFQQIISGLQYIQDRRICHRDLSLENVLLDSNNIAKIIDFGLAIGISVDANGLTCLLPPAGAVGKLFYMAPEIYRNQTPFNGFASDIWSSGIMLFIMVTGVPPFERPDETDPRFQMIAQGRMSELLEAWGLTHISASIRDLLGNMLVVEDPYRRYNIDQVMAHPWYNGF